jgi:hypothetical protein
MSYHPNGKFCIVVSNDDHGSVEAILGPYPSDGHTVEREIIRVAENLASDLAGERSRSPLRRGERQKRTRVIWAYDDDGRDVDIRNADLFNNTVVFVGIEDSEGNAEPYWTLQIKELQS